MATYYLREDGTASTKEAATDPTSVATSMPPFRFNAETFSAGDIVVVSGRGGVIDSQLAPPSSGVILEGEAEFPASIITAGRAVLISAVTDVVLRGALSLTGAGSADAVRIASAAHRARIDGITVPLAGANAVQISDSDNVLVLRSAFANCQTNGVIASACSGLRVIGVLVEEYNLADGNNDAVHCADCTDYLLVANRAINAVARSAGAAFDASAASATTSGSMVANYSRGHVNGYTLSGNARASDSGTLAGNVAENGSANDYYLYEAVACTLYHNTGTGTGAQCLRADLPGSDLDLTAKGNLWDGRLKTGDAMVINRALITALTLTHNGYVPGPAGLIRDVGQTPLRPTLAQWQALGFDASSVEVADALLGADYLPGAAALLAAGTWLAGVRGHDDLPLPLHPDIGAVQDRAAPGRRFGAGKAA